MNYLKALKELDNKKRYKDYKRISYNTRLIRDSESSISLQLWNTKIITWHSNGSIEINTGGWETNTTRSRLNDYLENYSIYTNRGTLYIRDLRDDIEYFYRSGLIQDSSGKCLLIPSLSVTLEKYAGRKVSSLEDIEQVISNMTLDQLQKFWKHCGSRYRKDCNRALIVKYCIKEFLPLISSEAGDSTWQSIFEERLN